MAILVLLTLLLTTMAKNSDNNSKILKELDLNDPKSSLSILQFNSNRKTDDQTLIICAIILGQNITITGQDAPKVENICKDKIKALTDHNSTTPPSPSSTNSQNSTSTLQTNNSNPNNNQQQNNTNSGDGGSSQPSQPGTVMQAIHDVGGFLSEVGQTVKGLFK